MRKFSEYIGSQFGNPRGFVGKCCCFLMNRINKAMYKRVVADLDLNKQSCVLDVGYGNGYLIEKIYAKYACNISGIDISEDMQRSASDRNSQGIQTGKIHLTVGNCCDLNFGNEMFDAVTSVNTIYFWEDTLKGLSEIYRVLKTDGVFYNAVYTTEWLQKLSYTRKGFQFFEKEDLILRGKKPGFSEIAITEIAYGKSYMVQYRK